MQARFEKSRRAFYFQMELQTRSPYPGDTVSYRIVARMCGERGCRATTPCTLHEQIIIRFDVDGEELRDAAKLSKQSYSELLELERDPRVLFHHLAEAALLANTPHRTRSIAGVLTAES